MAMFEFIELAKKSEFNTLSIREDVPFVQGPIYGKWQKTAGRKVRRFEIRQGEETLGFFQVIKYPLPLSKNLLYIPHGPVLKPLVLGEEFLKEFHKKLVEIGKEENAIFVRFDFFFSTGKEIDKFFKKVSEYAYHSFYFQPKFERRINLAKTEDALISAMHPKTRYNIRLAEKKGVKVEIISRNFEQYFRDFYKLLQETAKRDNFGLHPKVYYKNIFETLGLNNAFLAVARYNNKILLVNLVLLYGETAYFIFGGSSSEFKNLMFSYLAQWETLKEVKNRGMTVYNFGGVQGDKRGYENYEGISVFKKRFGGEFFEYSDSYDIVLKPFWYYLYNLRKWVLNLK